MSMLSGISDFFGLDIGTTGIRIVQLRGSGAVKSIYTYGQVDTDIRTATSDSKADQVKLAENVKQLVSQVGITTSNVAVGIPTSKVFTTIVDMQRLPSEEMTNSIKYQADSIIPTSIDQSKIDWAVIGDSPADNTKVEVLLSSVTTNFVEGRLDMVESIGLNVIALEPDIMALARALVSGGTETNLMVFDVGNNSSDLIITMKGIPRLTRAIPVGATAIIRSAMQHLSVDDKQAEQFVFKFGLGRDKLEGKVYNAIIETVDSLVSEVEKSAKFFKNRYNSSIERIIVTGAASIIPEFPLYLANKTSLNVEIGNAWTNVNFPPAQQNDLMTVANRFGVAAGLAERAV